MRCEFELALHGAILGAADHPAVADRTLRVGGLTKHGAQTEGAGERVRVGVVVRQYQHVAEVAEDGA